LFAAAFKGNVATSRVDAGVGDDIFMQSPNLKKLTSMHFYCWRRGLKTGMYYMRTKAAVDAIKFTVDQTALAATGSKAEGDTVEADVSKVMLGEEINKPVVEMLLRVTDRETQIYRAGAKQLFPAVIVCPQMNVGT
jgi:ribonucleotide reductase alpha subunit